MPLRGAVGQPNELSELVCLYSTDSLLTPPYGPVDGFHGLYVEQTILFGIPRKDTLAGISRVLQKDLSLPVCKLNDVDVDEGHLNPYRLGG